MGKIKETRVTEVTLGFKKELLDTSNLKELDEKSNDLLILKNNKFNEKDFFVGLSKKEEFGIMQFNIPKLLKEENLNQYEFHLNSYAASMIQYYCGNCFNLYDHDTYSFKYEGVEEVESDVKQYLDSIFCVEGLDIKHQSTTNKVFESKNMEIEYSISIFVDKESKTQSLKHEVFLKNPEKLFGIPFPYLFLVNEFYLEMLRQLLRILSVSIRFKENSTVEI